MSKFATGVVLFLLTCCLGSCGLLRHGRHGGQNVADTIAIAPRVDSNAIRMANNGAADSMKKVNEAAAKAAEEVAPYFHRRLSYKTFKGKAKMHYEGPDQKQEFTAHIRVKKDSIIWINITALSGVVQVARIYITPDSLFMVNNQDQEATRISLAQIGKILPTRVDFSALQNFLVGDPLRDGEIRNAVRDGDAWTFEVQDPAYIQRFRYSAADSTLLTSVLNMQDANGPKATVQYKNYMTVDGRRVSSMREVNVVKGTDTYLLEMNLQKIDLDEVMEYPFTIPANYTIKQQ